LVPAEQRLDWPGGFRAGPPERVLLPISFQLSCMAFLFPTSKGFFFISIQSFQLEFDCCDQKLSKQDEAVSCERKLRPPF
jgi:hypothetical protein